jgi:hypothetical protein
MALVKIKFAPSYTFMLNEGHVAQVRKDLAEGKYVEESALFTVNGDSKDAAYEVFDLTNNPGRQDDREQIYGRGRSLSTGDIVVVGEEQWLCMSFGWAEV